MNLWVPCGHFEAQVLSSDLIRCGPLRSDVVVSHTPCRRTSFSLQEVYTVSCHLEQGDDLSGGKPGKCQGIDSCQGMSGILLKVLEKTSRQGIVA